MLLVSLGSFEVERVVHRDGHLTGHALHELELGVCDALRHQAAEAHGAQAALRRGQRDDREGADVMLAEALQEFGEARFFLDVADDEGLLRLPDPSGRIVFNGSFRARGLFTGDARFENVEAHDVAAGIVENEGEEVEVDHGVQALGEVVEQRGQIALLGDGLANFQQGFKLTPGVFQRGGERHFRRRNNRVRHRRQDNTRVGEGST